MSQQDLKHELANAEAEPLLPVEKKLIAGSLIAGFALLAVLFVLNRFFPLAV